jgi:hypothetical protein
MTGSGRLGQRNDRAMASLNSFIDINSRNYFVSPLIFASNSSIRFRTSLSFSGPTLVGDDLTAVSLCDLPGLGRISCSGSSSRRTGALWARPGVLGACIMVNSFDVKSEEGWEMLGSCKDRRLAVKLEEGVRVAMSWREPVVVDVAIPLTVREESDPMRRSLSWANLAKELGICGIDEVVLLLARPGSWMRAWMVAGQFWWCSVNYPS